MAKHQSSNEVSLSVIITFHNEGLIAHKTMLNIFELLQPFDEEKISYEIILHVDNGDSGTLEYLNRYRDDSRIRIIENSFGNPSDSRNFCAKAARGRYLALLDGDDILSRNFLIDGFHMLEEHSPEPIILHVEADITFGVGEAGPRIWFMSDSRPDADEDTINMFTRNRWSAAVILPKSIALKYPYKPSRHGYGYEDWVFNMDTRHAGIHHRIVPESTKLYRVHAGSTYSLHGADNAVTYHSEMFNTPYMQSLAKRFAAGDFTIKNPNVAPKRFSRLFRRALGHVYDTISGMPHLGVPMRRYLGYVNRKVGRRNFQNLPAYVQDAWIAANQIDGEAWPDPSKLGHASYYSSDFNNQTADYCRLISQIRKDPDYLFLPPILSVGGTEKVLVNYISAFAEVHPDWHIVVFSALPEKHPYKIPDNVDFVDFYGLTKGMNWMEVDFLLSRFVVQTGVRRLHLIHNELAFNWIKSHLALFRDHDFKIYISQFMLEFNKDPRLKVGFVDPYIREIYPAIAKIFTDNRPMADSMIELDAFDESKVSVHYQPLLDHISPINQNSDAEDSSTASKSTDTQASSDTNTRPLRILWASRVSLQKRPDILKNIAKQLNPREYSIDVYGRFQPPYNKRFFCGAPAIHYKGTYNGIESLDLSSYDLFLYTSQTDGLPNVLLEIASSGLPIVASNDGGVSDLINSDTGHLVEIDDIDGYVAAIKDIRDNPSSAAQKAKKAQQIAHDRHSWEHFLADVERDID